MTKLPVALDRNPIVEATFEIRFSSSQSSAESLLHGMLFQNFKDEFPRSAALPASQIPPFVRATQPLLARQPTQALEGDGKRILIGDTVIALSHVAPYPGWGRFRELIERLSKALQDTGVAERIERFSLRYLNVIQDGVDEYDLTPFKLKCELDGFHLRGPGFSLRSEIELGKCVSVVELQSGVTVTVQSLEKAAKSYSGVRFSVDTIWQKDFRDFWAELPEMLVVAHHTAKQVFFGLLSNETIEKMGPKWE